MALPFVRITWVLLGALVCTNAFKKTVHAKLGLPGDVRKKPSSASLITTFNTDSIANETSEKRPDARDILKEEELIKSKSRAKYPCLACAKNKQLFEREEEVKAMRLSLVKELLRNKLHIYPKEKLDSETQHHTLSGKLPQYILDETQGKKDEDDIVTDEFDAWDKQTIQYGHTFLEQCPPLHAGACYRFDVNDLQTHRDNIQTTRLWLHTTTRSRHLRYELAVYQLMANNASVPGNHRMSQQIIYHGYTSIKDSWLQVDLTDLILSYLLSGAQTLYLAIACETCYRDNDPHILGTEDGYVPLLITDLLHRPNRRGKRSRQQECDPRTSCCKRDLFIHAASAGYHSIESPLILSIGYCYGSCNGLTDFSTSNTYMKDWAMKNPSEHNAHGLEFCCVPTNLVDISVRYTDNGTSRVGNLAHAKVETCGCL